MNRLQKLCGVALGLPVALIANGGLTPGAPSWPATVTLVTGASSAADYNTRLCEVYTELGNGMQSGCAGTVCCGFTAGSILDWDDHGQFSGTGHAFLFAPSTTEYDTEAYVGYYTSIIGLGTGPADTKLKRVSCYMSNGNVAPTVCPDSSPQNLYTGALNTFWRSAENFQTDANSNTWFPVDDLHVMTWAASQASPMRKVIVDGSVWLFQLGPTSTGFASGGFMADCIINGGTSSAAIEAGGQQQYLFRNTELNPSPGQKGYDGGIWNMVFVGASGAPETFCGNCNQISSDGAANPVPPGPLANCVNNSGCENFVQSCTAIPVQNVPTTGDIIEKPYIVADETLSGSSFTLLVPGPEQSISGPLWKNRTSPPEERSFMTNVVVATPDNTTKEINDALAAGYDVIFTPGHYQLDDTLVTGTSDQVLMGIGVPILISATGKPCIRVQHTGARVGGMIVQAGPTPLVDQESSVLIQWGTTSSDASGGLLFDCFTRTGRFTGNPAEPFNQVETMVHIVSDHVVCDDLWLWRADHDTQGLVKFQDDYCGTALIVDGDHVTIYGLACEHTLKDIMVWNGNHGKCHFYQCEMPYDAPIGYTATNVGYRVGNGVTDHEGWGIGVYDFFRDFHHVQPNGIFVNQPQPGIKFHGALTRYLANFGGISGVINGLGINVNQGPNVRIDFPGPAYVCEYSGAGGQPRQNTRSR